MAQALWNWWMSIWNISSVMPRTLNELFIQWECHANGAFFKKIWLAIFCIVLWSIWKERNARIFNHSLCSLTQIQELILARLSWWIKGWADPFPYSSDDIIRNPWCLQWSKPRPSISCPGIHHSITWCPPQHQEIKWNVDASYEPRCNLSAIGGVLRSEGGAFMCLFSCPIPPMEINSAEVYAIYRAIKITSASSMAKNHQIIIESDSQNAVSWCNDLNGGPWNLNSMLNYIRSSSHLGLKVSITHKGRASNIVADALAKQGLRRDADFVAWL